MFSGNIEACCNLRIFVALKIGAVMSLLVEERTPLGDHEPIFVSRYFIPHRPPTVKPLAVKPMKPFGACLVWRTDGSLTGYDVQSKVSCLSSNAAEGQCE